MLLLKLLGTLTLRSDAAPVPVAAQQKRPMGLLALLALAGKSGLPRERIEAYLWPETAHGAGRHSLDQTVYAIRHALSVDFIVSAARGLALDPDLLRVDLWEFEESIRDADWEAAAAKYEGPLLDGFHFGKSRELESWIDAERSRVLGEYQKAVENLAVQAASAGDHSRSIDWRRKLACSDPFSAGVAKKLINALAAGGDRAGAVKQARVYQELVRQQLEIEPDAEIERLAVDYARQADADSVERHVEFMPSPPDVAKSQTPPAPYENSVAPSAHGPHRRKRILMYSMIPIALLMTGAALWGWLRPEPLQPVVRFTLPIDSTEEIAPAVSDIGRMALSPDGSTLAYIGGARGELFVRRFSELRATKISDAEQATTPFFSPDGRQVGFLRAHMVRIASVSGGAPADVSDTLTGQAGASWGPDDFIYVAGTDWTGLFRVDAKPGAMPQPFTVLDTVNGETNHIWPDVLPNGKGLLFTVAFGGKASNDRPAHAIAVAEIPSGKHHLIVRDAMFARYAKSGHLLYVTTSKTLMVAPFDQKTMRVTGPATAVAEGMRLGLWGSADLAVSASGSLVYATGSGQLKADLVWVTRAGKVTTLDSTWSGNVLGFPAISPNGEWVAVSRRVSNEFISIWIKQLDGGGDIRLQPSGGYDVNPAWSPDGKMLTYASVGLPGAVRLWTRRADVSSEPPVLAWRQKESVYNPHWSPNGKWLIFQSEQTGAGRGDILGIRPGTDTVPVALVASDATEASPALSPDGRWLAYDSNETGDFEIYIVPFPNTGAAKWALSSGGGTEPQWSHKGNELFYRDKAGNLTAVVLTTTPRFSVGRRNVLFPAAAFESYEYAAQYAVGIDDKRFLMIREVDAHVPDKLVVVEHWFEELAGKARAAKLR